MLIDILTLIVLTATGFFVAYQAFETRRAAEAGTMSAQSLKQAERAYVGIQYRQKGDTGWTEDFSFHQCRNHNALAVLGPRCHRLHVRMTNTGKTPAEIIGGGIQCFPRLYKGRFDPPVSTPDGRGQIDPNFLHAGSHYSVKLTYILSDEEEAAMREKELWLVGYVDYADTFGTIHRAGFCRRVDPKLGSGKNNLFVDKYCDGYNYDKKIGEKPRPATA